MFRKLKNDIIEGNALLSNSIGEITDLFSNSNLDVLKCFKDVFKKDYIIKAFGGFIIIGIFFIEIIFSLIFYLNDMDKIMRYLYNISEYFINIYIKNDKNINIKNDNNKQNIKIKEPPKKISKKRKKNNLKNDYQEHSTHQIDSISVNKTKMTESNKRLFKINKKFKLFRNEENKNNIFSTKNLEKIQKTYGEINMDEYLKTNLNEMDYDNAIKNDKRTFCNYFWDRLKEKQIILNTFCNKENIIPLSIKIILLLLNINLYFVINGFFFSEEYIIQLYHLEEEDKFFSFFPRSINRFLYSTIVGSIIGIIIECLFIEEKRIKRIFIRNKDDSLKLKYEISLITKRIKKRYLIFILICFFISIFSWYYVNCFNNVYPGVKIEWIKSSITIIFIMQLVYIILVFIEAILRIISFKCKSEKIYKLKEILY